jgi:DNA-binding XRE family transcriptional regulator
MQHRAGLLLEHVRPVIRLEVTARSRLSPELPKGRRGGGADVLGGDRAPDLRRNRQVLPLGLPLEDQLLIAGSPGAQAAPDAGLGSWKMRPAERAARAFPKRLRNERRRRGLSRQEVAKMLGVTRQAVDSWERGISLPSFPQLITICDVFGWPNPLG